MRTLRSAMFYVKNFDPELKAQNKTELSLSREGLKLSVASLNMSDDDQAAA
jgi:hypothetical protein